MYIKFLFFYYIINNNTFYYSKNFKLKFIYINILRPNSKSPFDVTLELNDRFSQDIPKNYKLQFTNYSPEKGVMPTNEYIFTDNGKGG